MQSTRRTFLKLLGGALVGSCLGPLGGYAYAARVEPTWLAVERVTIPLKHLHSTADGFRIALMGDFHLHPFTQIAFVREAIARANALKPDLVVLVGDFVLQRADSIFELAPVLAQLNAKHGTFAVLGNHDLWTDAQVVRRGLEQAGLPVLDNTGVALSIGRATVYLAGLDDGWSGKPDLRRALDKQPQDAPTILLAHEPDFADKYSQDGRVSLQLSGHSHGGQVRLPGIGALVLPSFAEKYDQGLYQVNRMWLYTTRGIGVIGPPVRLNCRPEITEITLVSAG
jgi:predicted MPP superfamily phosphohydrolase